MQRMTFELLAKWCASKHNAKVIFDAQAQGASSNPTKNEIYMPCDLKEHNVLGALALLMHEAAHLKFSGVIPKEVSDGRIISHNILNAFEDLRIDLKNFRMLDNIKEFYGELLKQHVYPKLEEMKKEHLMTRCLINGILYNEGFQTLNDTEALKFNEDNNIYSLMRQAINDIESNNWEEVKKAIKKVKELFKIKDEDDPQIQEMQISIQQGGADENKKEGQSQGQGEGGQEKGSEGSGSSPAGLGGNEDVLHIGDTKRFLNPSSAWDKGSGIKGASKEIIGSAAFQELTKNSFKELLAVKEKRMVFEGAKLNTEAITSFFTGDIEELFHEDDIVKVKKSKIAFCLDASGSMSSRMIDGSDRKKVVVRTVRSIIEILKDIQEQEGLNISYDVWSFDTNAYKHGDNWEKEYSANSGGTDLYKAFMKVQADILSNQEIDGNKLVVLMTDGYVGKDEIDNLRVQIIKHGAEVKCMVVGIGAELTGAFVQTIAGESNIIADEHADMVIMETIKTMLE